MRILQSVLLKASASPFAAGLYGVRKTTLDFVFFAEPVESVIPKLWSVIVDESFRYAEATNDVGSQELKDQ